MLIIHRKRKFRLTFSLENEELCKVVVEVLSNHGCEFGREYYGVPSPIHDKGPILTARYSCIIDEELFDDFVKTLERKIEHVGIVGLHIEN